ncbi:MAG: hypothetical protein GX576_10325, partial [Thauera phenolivorans]|nr:hypothetical protein [Thauera phenolivorans]
VWGVLALTAVNAGAAVLPGRALSGGYELLRCVALMLPALALVSCVERAVATRWLKALCVVLSACFLALYLAHADGPHVKWEVYAWAERHFGNVHNLINVSALVLLGTAVITAFERKPGQRIVFGLLLVFGLWFQWVLKSEGTYLALLLCAFAWLAIRFGGVLRVIALVGLAAGVLAYVLLMSFPDVAKSAAGISLGGFEIRSVLNARIIELVAERPWLGFGMNSFKNVPEAAIDGVAFLYPHQIYLEALFSLGILGTAAFAGVLYGFFRFANRATILAEPLGMLGFLIAVYMAGKGLTDMKLVAVQPLGIILMSAVFMSRPAGSADREEPRQ